jgi:hypothetical protein
MSGSGETNADAPADPRHIEDQPDLPFEFGPRAILPRREMPSLRNLNHLVVRKPTREEETTRREMLRKADREAYHGRLAPQFMVNPNSSTTSIMTTSFANAHPLFENPFQTRTLTELTPKTSWNSKLRVQ